MSTKLLTIKERNALIDKIVAYNVAEYFFIAIGEDAGEARVFRERIIKAFNKLDDAKLLSFKFYE